MLFAEDRSIERAEKVRGWGWKSIDTILYPGRTYSTVHNYCFYKGFAIMIGVYHYSCVDEVNWPFRREPAWELYQELPRARFRPQAQLLRRSFGLLQSAIQGRDVRRRFAKT
jgi:hypothetical protein